LQDEGRSVCFVGDGINDSIALKQANVSVSLRGATTIATDTAQVVLMDASLSQLTHLFELAHDFDRNMQMNLVTTLIPGVICIGGVFFLHFGVLTAVLLYNAGLVAGVTNAMLPMARHRLTG
ncbi:MAG: heavy metal translocating P-type ATPase, partial [Chloroflexaceae bacterium]|nr:heavy metal translocating P-type ATPase [Chloroflexaceae bacterium]